MSKVKLKELCKPNQIGKYGIPASAEDYDTGKVRYLRISDIDDYGNLLDNDKKSVSSDDINKYLLEEGDLVVARTGNSTGRTYYHENKNGVLAFAGFLIKYGLDKSKVNPKYLKYYTISKEYKEWVKNLSVGSTRGNINAQTFAECPINLPIRKQQNLLVDILSALDNKIELNNKINAELEAMAKTLYDYWFVQFDFPDANGKPYKSSGGKMIWNETLKREIPEGWEVKKMGKVLKTYLGGTPSTKNKNFWDGDIPWMNSGEVANFPLIETEQKITQEAIDKSSTKKLSKGSVLLSITRHLRVNVLGIDACINQSIAGIEENDTFKNAYIYFSVYNDIDRLMSLRTGAQQPHLNKEIVDSSPFIVPKNKILQEYYTIVTPALERIVNNAKQNQELNHLRDWLLPMLMNGQVTVGETEEKMGMVAEKGVEYKN